MSSCLFPTLWLEWGFYSAGRTVTLLSMKLSFILWMKSRLFIVAQKPLVTSSAPLFTPLSGHPPPDIRIHPCSYYCFPSSPLFFLSVPFPLSGILILFPLWDAFKYVFILFAIKNYWHFTKYKCGYLQKSLLYWELITAELFGFEFFSIWIRFATFKPLRFCLCHCMCMVMSHWTVVFTELFIKYILLKNKSDFSICTKISKVQYQENILVPHNVLLSLEIIQDHLQSENKHAQMLQAQGLTVLWAHHHKVYISFRASSGKVPGSWWAVEDRHVSCGITWNLFLSGLYSL